MSPIQLLKRKIQAVLQNAGFKLNDDNIRFIPEEDSDMVILRVEIDPEILYSEDEQEEAATFEDIIERLKE